MRGKTAIATMLILVIAASVGLGQEADESDVNAFAFFESNIRPVLVRHCYECHSAEQGVAEGGLKVDSRSAIRKGGDRGPAVVPGRPEASLLLSAVLHADSDLKMPPKQARLSAKVCADLKKWIAMGAPDPRRGGRAGQTDSWDGLDAAKTHWAYQAPKQTKPPTTSNPKWVRDEIDSFVLARLDAAGVQPANDAKPHVLLRRLHFDLVGLPPSSESIDRFVADVEGNGIDHALAEEADRLLESNHFGERWGRHWLDVARFAESSGGESNISFPHAWRFRDYVINAVNADIPYDQFLTEQIAGDLLPSKYPKQRARLLIATGFLAVGTKNLGENNVEQFAADIVDEQIDSLTRAVMGSSVACARCHHHKFDPFTMDDYYALAGIFHSTKTYFGTHTSPANRRSGDPLPLPRTKGQQVFHASLSPEKFSEMKQRKAELDAEWAEMQAAQTAAFSGQKPERSFTLREVLANIWRRGPIDGKLESLDENGRAIPLAMGVLDRDEIIDAALLARGEIARPGDTVPRGVPTAIHDSSHLQFSSDRSGRLELARWITDRSHPLTSRVMVNRVWHHLFGSGLVATTDDFGTTGDRPSHPELLDTLAVQFVEDDWSVKRLVRRLVLSRTWRQSSAYRQDAFQIDPENRLLWRMSKRRLEAEAIRDAMLVASGELDRNPPSGSLVARAIGDKLISLIGLNKKLPSDLDASTHRSVYLPVIRARLPDVLELFDFAEPSLVTGKRDQTNVPVQALYLMNSDFVQDRAIAMARRLVEASSDREARVNSAFLLCFARTPDQTELERSLKFLDAGREEHHESDQSALDASSPMAHEAAAREEGHSTNSLAPKPTHFAPRAKRVIFLCMNGGPSHLDLFDPKPMLGKYSGNVAPKSVLKGNANLLASPFEFKQHGQSGQWISELFPHLAKQADKLCLIRSMNTDLPNHSQAFLQMHTGSFQFTRPSLGAWTVYGMGSENQNLPGFITLNPPSENGGARNYGNAFLPAVYQATKIGANQIPEFYRKLFGVDSESGPPLKNIRNDRISRDVQRRQLDLIQDFNAHKLRQETVHPEIEGAIESLEIAFRMQDQIPSVMDLSAETKTTLQNYGIEAGQPTDSFGRQCLMARRLAEAGVRFIEVTAPVGWDHHFQLNDVLPAACKATDKPIAALLSDLQQRGLLDDTLVIWAGEFGRTPYAQSGTGRDHNNKGYTIWMAGGGVKPGYSYGATDDLGYEAVDNPVHIHDWHATVLHLLGFDHKRLTFHYAGRDYRLTDVHGTVVNDIMV